MLTREGIVEAVTKHAVVDLGGTHAVAPAAAIHQVRRAIHVLHTARDRDLHLACHDLLRSRDDGLSAGAAHAVHRHGRDRHRYAAADRSLPCGIHLVAGLDDVAHDDAADCPGVESRSLQRFAHHDRPQIRCRDRLQRTVVGADRGADRAAENDVIGAHRASPSLIAAPRKGRKAEV